MVKDNKIDFKKKHVEISTPEEFIRVAAEFHGFTAKELLGPSRKSELVDVRSKIVKALVDKWNMNYTSIARIMSRDHTSIIYLYRRPVSKLWTVPQNPMDGIVDTLGVDSEAKKPSSNQ